MIEWSDSLSIGIPEIDDQHRVFIGLLNRLDAVSTSEAGKSELREILAEVVSYAEHHFIDEERHMVRAGYPLVTEHIGKHDAAAAKIHDLLTRDADEIELYRFLSNILESWLTTHIMADDKVFGAWFWRHCPAETAAQDVITG